MKLVDFYRNSFRKMSWNVWLQNLDSDQQDIIYKLINNVKSELSDHQIKMHIIPLHMYEGIYSTDHLWESLLEKEGGMNYSQKEFIIFAVCLNNKIFDLRKGILSLSHNIFLTKSMETVNEIFLKNFGNRYEWDHSIRPINIDMN